MESLVGVWAVRYELYNNFMASDDPFPILPVATETFLGFSVRHSSAVYEENVTWAVVAWQVHVNQNKCHVHGLWSQSSELEASRSNNPNYSAAPQ